MTLSQTFAATGLWFIIVSVCYTHCKWSNVRDCYLMLFKREYWKPYNTIEFVSWVAKAIIIIPGLVFHYDIWQLYYLTLITSVALIWASREKSLPTLVGFNTMWAWLSLAVLSQHLLK